MRTFEWKRRWIGWYACLALGVTLLAPLASAHAQQTDDDRARMHFQSGLSYYEQARYADAAREFTQAYELSQRPALLLNLSQAYERDLKFAEAIAELERYLQVLPESPQRRTVETRIARLRELQARMAPAPNTPQPAPISEPEPTTDVVPTSEPVTSPEPAPVAATQSTPRRGGVSMPGLILAATGGALLAGSLVTGLMAHSTYSDLDDRCPGGACPPEENAQDDIDSGKTMAWISTGLFAGGVITAAIGTVLLLTYEGEDSAPTTTAGLSITPEAVVGTARIAF